VRAIFEDLWTSGADPADPQRFAALCESLEGDPRRVAGAEVKDALKRNTAEATATGVFGVPSFVVDGEVFWGVDSLDFVKAFLEDRAVLASGEMQRLEALPVGAKRPG